MQNVIIFVAGLIALNVGLWQIHPAAPWLGTGLVLMSLVLAAAMIRQPQEAKRERT